MTFWSTFSERLNPNVDERRCQRELLCMFKTCFSDQRSPPIPGDHRRSLAITQCSSGAIPGTMGHYQRFIKARKRLPECHGVTAP